MRKILRSCRNALYRSFIHAMWKDFAFRYFIVEAATSSHPYDLRYARGQMARMTVDEQDFFRFVINHSNESCSLGAQDLWCLYEMKEARNRFFVEFGATDGVNTSNTALMEKLYGWNGILAEPNPIWHESLVKNRSAIVDTRCVYSTTGQALDFFNADVPGYAGVAQDLQHSVGKRLGVRGRLIKVQTISLNDLLESHYAPAKIDFMSVDTEGSEYEILRALDFRKWRVELFTVELGPPEKDLAIDRLMMDNGYARRFENFSGADAWYKKIQKMQ
jgi:FkbM family methyltransferase